METIKYTLYHMFLYGFKNNKNIFISGNDVESCRVIEIIKTYNMPNVFYDWEGNKGINISLNHVKENFQSNYKITDTKLTINYGNGVLKEDIAYMIISAYMTAKRRFEGETGYRYNMCI